MSLKRKKSSRKEDRNIPDLLENPDDIPTHAKLIPVKPSYDFDIIQANPNEVEVGSPSEVTTGVQNFCSAISHWLVILQYITRMKLEPPITFIRFNNLPPILMEYNTRHSGYIQLEKFTLGKLSHLKQTKPKCTVKTMKPRHAKQSRGNEDAVDVVYTNEIEFKTDGPPLYMRIHYKIDGRNKQENVKEQLWGYFDVLITDPVISVTTKIKEARHKGKTKYHSPDVQFDYSFKSLEIFQEIVIPKYVKNRVETKLTSFNDESVRKLIKDFVSKLMDSKDEMKKRLRATVLHNIESDIKNMKSMNGLLNIFVDRYARTFEEKKSRRIKFSETTLNAIKHIIYVLKDSKELQTMLIHAIKEQNARIIFPFLLEKQKKYYARFATLSKLHDMEDYSDRNYIKHLLAKEKLGLGLSN